MSTLIARLSTEQATHELVRKGGVYTLRTYYANPESERVLTPLEAGEWVDTVRRYGGETHAPLGQSLKIPPRTAVAEGDSK